jgi:hypothetical protein
MQDVQPTRDVPPEVWDILRRIASGDFRTCLVGVIGDNGLSHIVWSGSLCEGVGLALKSNIYMSALLESSVMDEEEETENDLG